MYVGLMRNPVPICRTRNEHRSRAVVGRCVPFRRRSRYQIGKTEKINANALGNSLVLSWSGGVESDEYVCGTNELYPNSSIHFERFLRANDRKRSVKERRDKWERERRVVLNFFGFRFFTLLYQPPAVFQDTHLTHTHSQNAPREVAIVNIV